MKMWEMIKELMGNEDKVFVSEKGEAGEMTAESEGGDIGFRYRDNLRSSVRSIDLQRVWEEVKQPVSFMEAVGSGKAISVEHDYLIGLDNIIGYSDLDYLLCELGYQFTKEQMSEILIQGKFYIED